jgi:putative endonuclease
MITIYILKLADGTHYTGITKDLSRRMSEHNRGKCRYTHDKLPFSIIHTEEKENYKTAATLERHIKNTGTKRYLKSLELKKLFGNQFVYVQ